MAKFLASAGGDYLIPGEVKLWSVENKNVFATLKGHQFGIKTITFSSNVKVLVSGDSLLGELKFWTVTILTYQSVQMLLTHAFSHQMD